MEKIDVVALGELLIDFTENGTSEQGNPIMEANPGGAPCNVLAMLTRLGYKTAFIGKVGKDMFGNQLRDALVEVGIMTQGLIMDEEVHTTLAFVHTFADGDRDFSFYRKPGADMCLEEGEINEEMINNSVIFHLGSLSMTDEPVRSATYKALDLARAAGKIISFDPNLREPLWDSLDSAKMQIAYGMERCDILKISDNEIQWFTGLEDYDEGAARLLETYPNIKLMLVSLGKEGSLAFSRKSSAEASNDNSGASGIANRAFVPAFVQKNTIETTGAGDTFCAGVLHYVLENGLKEYNTAELESMLTFANAAASIVTTRKGALRVMPSRQEVEAVVVNRGRS